MGGGPSKRSFTDRQGSILELIAEGLTDKQIALRLGVSSHTVRSHLDRLFRAHGLHNRAGALAVWLEMRQRTVSSRGTV